MCDLPDFRTVDFTNSDTLSTIAGQLITAANNAGIFGLNCRNKTQNNTLQTVAKEWIRQTDKVIDSHAPADALEVISFYDLIHRIAYGRPALPEIINRHVLRAFDSMIRGDKDIDRYTLFRQIALGLNRKDKAYTGRPLQWHSICLDRWHTQFNSGFSSEPLSEYDTIQRVSILLESNLWILEAENETAFKQLLFNNHRHLLSPTL